MDHVKDDFGTLVQGEDEEEYQFEFPCGRPLADPPQYLKTFQKSVQMKVMLEFQARSIFWSNVRNELLDLRWFSEWFESSGLAEVAPEYVYGIVENVCAPMVAARGERARPELIEMKNMVLARIREVYNVKACATALAMGAHPRLGEHSSLNDVAEHFPQIWSHVRP